ncbi:MarR family transcriptional regulator [Yangia mangrovi]|uniref:Transcriptional regulator n=1 Tax=Alloyangia mangrovi TaxID=1779329 RepID=A0A2A3JWG1_9RHOB|nr:MarR family transcriptional regulator [Alloyangia mangrovi]MCA0941307.1 MarR family transcriptional regulator [Alloyangia pacifica]MCA0945585.1 MarR family transcriptional regulator [Alloyangia pacifica]MCT4369897.1 MarR family transcriptional regulator [Alloyangia mangrovi]
MTQTPSPRDRFGFAFVTLARQWHRVVDKRLAEAGLSDATWRPLVHLAEGGDGISQRDLAARISLDTSTLVRLLDLLETRGFVERRVDPSDRRARRIHLTEEGRTELARIRAMLLQAERELLADIADDETSAMLDAFSRIAVRADAMLSEKVEA